MSFEVMGLEKQDLGVDQVGHLVVHLLT